MARMLWRIVAAVNSHSMSPSKTPLKSRKTPVQARSAATVDAMLEAAVQVLVDHGMERLTTTRVAERAGVSVGTLYQYYPNKQALLAAVLERHLLQVVESVERVCAAQRGQPVRAMLRALVDSFIDAKMARVEASRALYAVSSRLEGAALVAKLGLRSQAAVSAMLATASDLSIRDADMASFVLLNAAIGPVQAALSADASGPLMGAVRQHLAMLAEAYLRRLADEPPGVHNNVNEKRPSSHGEGAPL